MKNQSILSFKYGDKVLDLSDREGTVVANPYGKPGIVRVAFGKDGKSDWRDLSPDKLRHKPYGSTDGHTPGEWKVVPISDCCLTIQIDGFREDKKGGYIAEIKWERNAGGIGKEDEANARLIASAPTLLKENEQLKEQVRVLRVALVKAKDWFYVHGKNGKIYADGVKPACIAWIESALSQTETK